MGTIIGFSGVDGSGKTTIAENLKDKLTKQGYCVTYHHELDFYILKEILRLLTKIRGEEKAESLKEDVLRKKDVNTSLITEVYYLSVWVDNLLTYYYFKLKRGVIICDRWAYDIFANFEFRGYNNWFIRKLYSIFPRPDVFILFTVPPEVSLERKKDDEGHIGHTVEYYEKIQKGVFEIAKKYGYFDPEHIIDSNKPVNEVVDDVINLMRKKGIDV